MSTMALKLASSFVDVERDEMEYVDGGLTIYHCWWGTQLVFSQSDRNALTDILGGVAVSLGAFAAYMGAIAFGCAVPTFGLSLATAGQIAGYAGLAAAVFGAGAWFFANHYIIDLPGQDIG